MKILWGKSSALFKKVWHMKAPKLLYALNKSRVKGQQITLKSVTGRYACFSCDTEIQFPFLDASITFKLLKP